MERNNGRVDVRQLTHDVDDVVCRLVVEHSSPRLTVRPTWQEHADLGLAVSELGGEFECGPPKTAIRAVDDVQRKTSKPELLPAGDQELGARVVNIEMHRMEIVRSERAGVLHR